ncbi:hypothetical protein KI387_040618, partial [Taxus chinensis]
PIEYEGLDVKCFYCGIVGRIRKNFLHKIKKLFEPKLHLDVDKSTPPLPSKDTLKGSPPPQEDQICAKDLIGALVHLLNDNPSEAMSPLSLLRNTKEVHRESSNLASLIKEGLRLGKSSSFETLTKWIAQENDNEKQGDPSQ